MCSRPANQTTVKFVTKTVGTKKVITKVPITKSVTKKVVVSQKTVRATVAKVIKVPIKVTAKPPPPKIRVITVTAAKTVIYVIKGGVRTPSTVKKGDVVTVTESVNVPTAKTVTTTVVEEEVFEDEVTEKGGDEDGDVEDEPEDDSNKIIGKGGDPDQTPTDEEVEAAIGGEDISDEEREKLKEEKISNDSKELLEEANKTKDTEMEDDEEDISYFKKLRFRRA